MRNRNMIRVLRDVQLFGVAPVLASVVTFDNTLNPSSAHFLEVTEPVNEPTWVAEEEWTASEKAKESTNGNEKPSMKTLLVSSVKKPVAS